MVLAPGVALARGDRSLQGDTEVPVGTPELWGSALIPWLFHCVPKSVFIPGWLQSHPFPRVSHRAGDTPEITREGPEELCVNLGCWEWLPAPQTNPGPRSSGLIHLNSRRVLLWVHFGDLEGAGVLCSEVSPGCFSSLAKAAGSRFILTVRSCCCPSARHWGDSPNCHTFTQNG